MKPGFATLPDRANFKTLGKAWSPVQKKSKNPLALSRGFLIYYALVRPNKGGSLFENGFFEWTCLLKKTWNSKCLCESFKTQNLFLESLILAQNERW